MMLFIYLGCLRFSEMGKSSDVRHALRIQNVSFTTERGNASLSFTLESYKSPSEWIKLKISSFARYSTLKFPPCAKSWKRYPATRDWFAKQLKRLTAIAGLDEGAHNTHSFRTGRNTDLDDKGCIGPHNQRNRTLEQWCVLEIRQVRVFHLAALADP